MAKDNPIMNIIVMRGTHWEWYNVPQDYPCVPKNGVRADQKRYLDSVVNDGLYHRWVKFKLYMKQVF